MSYPPPNEPHQPGPGGGFGPPQGFGPSEPAGPPGSPPGGYGYPGPPGNPPGGYGYPGPPGTPPGGYGPGGPGGYGPGGPGGYPPPPNGGGNGPNKVAITVIAVVLGIAVAIGVVLLVSSGDDDKNQANVSSSSSPTPEESADEPDPTPTDPPTSIPSPNQPSTVPTQPAEPSIAPTVIPYVVLSPGTCFNHPALNSGASGIDRRSCNESHDAEVISNRKVSGDFATDTAIQQAALAMCEKDARTRLQKMPQDGTVYFPFALYPLKSTYDLQGKDTVSCAMTLSNTKDGKQLAAPLPGG